MSDTDVLPKVQEVFTATFNVDPQSITIETTPKDVADWDSVGHLSLGASLEEAFKISLDVDDLMGMENVREIVRIINTKLSKKV